MENIRIRQAKLADVDGLVRLLKQISMLHHQGRPDLFKPNSQKFSAEEIEKILSDKDFKVFVAIDDKDCMLGYCFCKLRSSSHPVLHTYTALYIEDFCVDESSRGQGIGKKLFDTALEYGKSQDVYNIELNVWNFNEGAVRFYESLGFSARSTVMERVL